MKNLKELFTRSSSAPRESLCPLDQDLSWMCVGEKAPPSGLSEGKWPSDHGVLRDAPAGVRSRSDHMEAVAGSGAARELLIYRISAGRRSQLRQRGDKALSRIFSA